MRVVVTRISQDDTMRRRMVDIAASGDVGPWEELAARALAAPSPYHPVPGEPVYHLRVDDQVVLVAEHDLSGPLYDLVIAVLAIGDPWDTGLTATTPGWRCIRSTGLSGRGNRSRTPASPVPAR